MLWCGSNLNVAFHNEYINHMYLDFVDGIYGHNGVKKD